MRKKLDSMERADFIRLWISGNYCFKELVKKFNISYGYGMKLTNEWQERRKNYG